MNVLLMGGYFASGKTTILTELAAAMLKQGKRICLIGNKEETYGIDGGMEFSTLRGGCICCQATGSLIEALKRIEQEITPDWVLIELAGIGFQDSVRDAITDYVSSTIPIFSVTVVDAVRWKKLLKAAEPVMIRQVRGADLIIVNKTDLNPDISIIMKQITSIHEAAALLPRQRSADTVETLLTILDQQT